MEPFQTENPLGELRERIRDALSSAVKEVADDIEEVPEVRVSNRFDQGDFSMMWAPYCSKRKINPGEFTERLAQRANSNLDGQKEEGIIRECRGAGPYLNIVVNRALVFRRSIEAIVKMGSSYGKRTTQQGKRAIVEHTSSNPNAPLHIGNLRNVMIGAHLAKLFKAVGYDVKEVFYVNDLGAQIGLTALGYYHCYHKVKPSLKIDQWIGALYAVMNTCSELQEVRVDLGELEKACQEGEKPRVNHVHTLLNDNMEDQASLDKRNEYIDIYMDLRGRYPELVTGTVAEVKHIRSIKEEAAKLNLAYERQEDWAVRIFRKMVTDCLTGVQETLNTYNIQHDRFDFESELGWEGANEKVLSIMKSSDYFVPPTDCNEKGKPEGGYLDMAQFIKDQGFKIGKGGFPKDFPRFYVLRPDGSTLYTFRDVVYSFKKVANADLVCNVISSEQDVAQQKVALSLYMMNPSLINKQAHLSYELVKLTTGKMSGRRGRYLLADDLYNELREVLEETMRERNKEKGEVVSEEWFNGITHEVATAAMKYALLSVSSTTLINFDVNKVTSFEEVSAPFILYNRTRLASLEAKFKERKDAGWISPLPPLEQVDFSFLDDQKEWEIFMLYVLPLPELIQEAACPRFPSPPALPEFGVHKVCDYLYNMVRHISTWYGPSGVRILPSENAEGRGGEKGTHARMHLLSSFKQCLDNALRLVMMEPLERM